jgi:ribosomal protein S18 acetylase RimI-like enzyme
MNALTRDATAEDLGTIDQLFRASFTGTFAHLYSERNLTTFLAKFTPESWASEFADPRFAFRIAELRGDPVGYLKLGPMDLPVATERLERAREIYQFYLLDSAKGSGIADELMSWAIEKGRALGGSELYLSVFVDNHRARRFYERHGFDYVGPYHFMVGDQADEDIIMSRRL